MEGGLVLSFLEVKNVTKSFGGLIALKNVSFQAKQGEILGCIGMNGAGKTTLFNVITGFYKPDSGKIIFKGEDITGQKPFKVCKKGISRTFQIVRPFSEMTVLQNVMMGLIRGEMWGGLEELRDEATELLDFIGLLAKEDLPAGSLTFAEQRRLELARALAMKPELLMLDEVIAGLNPTEVVDITKLISKLSGRGITLFLIEHVMKAIMSISKRIIVLDYGQLIADGTPRSVSKNEKVVKTYLGEKYSIA